MSNTIKINLENWVRGGRDNNGLPSPSGLRVFNKDAGGVMCCLGFACVNEGVDSDLLLHAGMPYALGQDAPKWLAIENDDYDDLFCSTSQRYEDTPFSQQAAAVNDDPGITDAVRIYTLCRLFAAVDKVVEFSLGGRVVASNQALQTVFHINRAIEQAKDAPPWSTLKGKERKLMRDREYQRKKRLRSKPQ